jgi:hypothetical protein
LLAIDQLWVSTLLALPTRRTLSLWFSALIWSKQLTASNTKPSHLPGYNNVGRAWIEVGQI